MDQRDDWTWKVWPRASRLRHNVLVVSFSFVLLVTGAGLALLLTALMGGGGAKDAGLSAVSLRANAMSTLRVSRSVDPSVVDINTVVQSPGGPSNVAGTGMIFRSDGFIVTNNHVVEDATTIKVTVPGQKKPYEASFVGADPSYDVAVVHIPGVSRLPTVELGNSSDLALGQAVFAIGNALGLGGKPSVTSGTVSALDRSITATSETGADAEALKGMIEADSPIVPGNSGGPLVDSAGRVVGMDTAASPSSGRRADAVAFALPINKVASIAESIEKRERRPGLVIGRTAYLGIEGVTVNLLGGLRSAVNVVQVEPGMPASMAGMEPGDLIVSFAGSKTSSMRRLSALIHRYRPGSVVPVTFQTGGSYRTVQIRLVAGPAA